MWPLLYFTSPCLKTRDFDNKWGHFYTMKRWTDMRRVKGALWCALWTGGQVWRGEMCKTNMHAYLSTSNQVAAFFLGSVREGEDEREQHERNLRQLRWDEMEEDIWWGKDTHGSFLKFFMDARSNVAACSQGHVTFQQPMFFKILIEMLYSHTHTRFSRITLFHLFCLSVPGSMRALCVSVLLVSLLLSLLPSIGTSAAHTEHYTWAVLTV